ncbi:MAG TPA: NUDIX domain-containing protein [Ktedonobacterales bacterium]
MNSQQRLREPLAVQPGIRELDQRRAGCRLEVWARRAFYHTWRMLPTWCQDLAVRIAAPKVTMGACAVIVDGRGRVLLAHHTYRARPWGLPGGLIGSGEQPAAGLERELHEELGVLVQVGPVLSAEKHPRTHQLTLYYRAALPGTPREDGIEIDELRYVAPEEVTALLGDEADVCLRCMQVYGEVSPVGGAG